MTSVVNKSEVWSPGHRVIMLFIMAYILLYILPFPFDDIPLVSIFFDKATSLNDSFTLWVGRNVLDIKSLHKVLNTGSGDTTFNYVQLLSQTFEALIIAFLLFGFYRKKDNFNSQLLFVRLYARYYLGVYMVVYGLAKLYNGQFAPLGLSTLNESFGDSSPMGLLWTFMGYSRSYSIFSGIGEIAGGILLLFRRTTYAGCLITIGVMMNVAMMNFSFDVPVKLFSCHLILISFFLLAPALKSIVAFFFLQQPSRLSISRLWLPKRWMRWCRVSIKSLLVASIPAIAIAEAFSKDNIQSTSKFDGVYKTKKFFAMNHRSASSQEDFCLTTFILEDGHATLSVDADSNIYCKANIDTVSRVLSLISDKDSTVKYQFRYSIGSNNDLNLKGVYKGDNVDATFLKKETKDYRLVNRGFHWINEYPYNR